MPITNMALKISGFVKGLIVPPSTGYCRPNRRTRNIVPKNQFLVRKTLMASILLFEMAMAFVLIHSLPFLGWYEKIRISRAGI